MAGQPRAEAPKPRLSASSATQGDRYLGPAILLQAARWIKYTLYRTRVLPRTRVPALTVSVGNLSTGGSGKTPLAAWIAEFLAGQGVTACCSEASTRSTSREVTTPRSGTRPAKPL